jgi:type IV secretory pathway TrbD component
MAGIEITFYVTTIIAGGLALYFSIYHPVIFLKRMYDLSTARALGITVFTIILMDLPVIIVLVSFHRFLDTNVELIIACAVIMNYILGVAATSASYWLFTVSIHRASMRKMLKLGLALPLVVYYGTLVGLLISLVTLVGVGIIISLFL